MNATLEARKLSIIEYLAEIEDEALIQQIEALLKPSVDFWDELNEVQKASIRPGLEQLKNGQRTDYKTFILNFKKQRKP